MRTFFPNAKSVCDQVRDCGMADQFIFYTHPMSRGRIVRWMLEEIGQPYRTELLTTTRR
jgi:hypothetical protein